jgi:hypothetical protein
LQAEAQHLVQRSLLKRLALKSVTQVPLKVLDPVLKVAAKLLTNMFFTPLIKRPLATGFLVTDPDSPLYKKPEFQKGFQLSDIAEAWERTGNVYETIGGEKYLKRSRSFSWSSIQQISYC